MMYYYNVHVMHTYTKVMIHNSYVLLVSSYCDDYDLVYHIVSLHHCAL